MLPGGSYEEVTRWLWNFANSHAKRESPRVEAVVETPEGREGKSYGLRLRIRERFVPPMDQPPQEFAYPDVADGLTRFAWCDDLAKQVRGWARELLQADSDLPPKSA